MLINLIVVRPPNKRAVILLANLLFCLASFQIVSQVVCLKISSIEIPAAVSNGSQVTFVCNYKLSKGDQLYSIKWYKNYVEFYRYQPNQQQQQPTTTTTTNPQTISEDQQRAGTSSGDQVAANLKTEFELDGINLDLSKSNATHVHLKQVNLASEATYKCEISADSPSFETISLERQMRVYVLPKQKLYIVDNLQAAPPGGGQQSYSATQQPSGLYNLNDQINLTCFAGASRPAARLTWLLNDRPISVSSDTKWLTLSSRQLARNELIEAQLNLAFRLQSSVLSYLSSSWNNSGSSSIAEQAGGNLNGAHPSMLRLRCVSRLVVEFSSQTSILVSGGGGASGGKTLIKRRQQQPQQQRTSEQPPSSSAYSLSRPGEDEDGTTTGSSERANSPHQSAARNNQQVYPLFKWPPKPSDETNFWLLTTTTTSTTGGQQPNQDHDRIVGGNNNRLNQRQLIVWTNRQLRAQTEHIEQLVVKRAHPNELETPIIEARTQLDETGRRLKQQDELLQPPQDEAALLLSTRDDEEEEQQHGAAATTAGYNNDDGQDLVSTESTSSTVPDEYAGSSGGSADDEAENDHELNESVQFNCKAQTRPAELESIRSVHLKWFINDKEILNENRINSFDGTRFQYSKSAANRRLVAQDRPDELSSLLPTTTIKPSEDSLEQTGPSGSSFWHLSEIKERALSLELTPSLIQLNGLQLKCKTVLEQPLIEYETNQFLFSIATNPFIQVAPMGDQQQSRNHQQLGRLNHANNSRKFASFRPHQAGATNTNQSYLVRPKFGVNKNGNNNQHLNAYKLRQSNNSAFRCCSFNTLGVWLIGIWWLNFQAMISCRLLVPIGDD